MLSSFRAGILSSSSKRAARGASAASDWSSGLSQILLRFYVPLTANHTARRKTDRGAPRPGARARLLETHDVQDDGCVADVLVRVLRARLVNVHLAGLVSPLFF